MATTIITSIAVALIIALVSSIINNKIVLSVKENEIKHIEQDIKRLFEMTEGIGKSLDRKYGELITTDKTQEIAISLITERIEEIRRRLDKINGFK